MSEPGMIKKLGAKSNELFGEFCTALSKHETELAVAIPAAVALGIAVHQVATNPAGAAEAVVRAVETAKEVYEVAKTLHEAVELAGAEESVKDMAEYAAHGYVTPLLTTQEGLKMVMKSPIDLVKGYSDMLVSGFSNVKAFFDGPEGKEAMALATGNAIDVKKPLYDSLGHRHKLVKASEHQFVTSDGKNFVIWDRNTGAAANATVDAAVHISNCPPGALASRTLTNATVSPGEYQNLGYAPLKTPVTKATLAASADRQDQHDDEGPSL
jgi:hypothetical protein